MPLQAYSAVSDLLLGDTVLGSTVDPEKYVQDAADEIDSKVGFMYVTPLNLQTAPRPVQLLLKRINNFLATGRLIMAVASPSEEGGLNAYGRNLVEAASESLDAIAAGKINLEGVQTIADGTALRTAPMVSNIDSESSVEAFYDRIANPSYVYPAAYIPQGWIG